MKILYDATALSRKRTGIENVTFQLLKTLLEIDTHNEYVVIFRNVIDPDIKAIAGKNVKIILSKFASQVLTEQIFIPWAIFRNKPDIALFCCFPPGILVSGNIGIYCHDATNWRYKNYLSWKNRLYFKPLTEIALRRSRIIFTNSSFSSSDIQLFFNLNNKSPVIISPALNYKNVFQRKKSPDDEINLQKYGIKKKYLFCVGSLEPRKNVEFIIKNVGSILQKFDMDLVLTGRKAWGNNSIGKAIQSVSYQSRIIKTGFVSNEELNFLYRNAELFLFPSYYEGFGFPILEAFACSCPVITSNVSSMPEVAGDAAIQIDPSDGEQLSNAIKSILTDSGMRKKLVEKGSERLKYFSWRTSAEKLIKAIENLTLSAF